MLLQILQVCRQVQFIYSMLNSKSQNPGVVSIKKICDGLNITLSDFFDSDIFDDLDCEIGALHRKGDKP